MSKKFVVQTRLPRLNDRGFTLIEALVAIGVLSIGILSMHIMQTGSVRGNSRANHISAATMWAADKMEKINALDYGDKLLQDKNNDGTNQDTDRNGIDDDDDGMPGDNISNFGLDQATQTTADYTISNLPGGFTMYYNVAVDQPLEKIKTIRVIVVRNSDQQQFVFDYNKAALL